MAPSTVLPTTGEQQNEDNAFPNPPAHHSFVIKHSGAQRPLFFAARGRSSTKRSALIDRSLLRRRAPKRNERGNQPGSRDPLGADTAGESSSARHRRADEPHICSRQRALRNRNWGFDVLLAREHCAMLSPSLPDLDRDRSGGSTPISLNSDARKPRNYRLRGTRRWEAAQYNSRRVISMTPNRPLVSC
jgi:hypothetical protein